MYICIFLIEKLLTKMPSYSKFDADPRDPIQKRMDVLEARIQTSYDHSMMELEMQIGQLRKQLSVEREERMALRKELEKECRKRIEMGRHLGTISLALGFRVEIIDGCLDRVWFCRKNIKILKFEF
jgi:hypothetical protein